MRFLKRDIIPDGRTRREALASVPLWMTAIGSGAFMGFVPVASGTVASLGALILYYFTPLSEITVALGVATLVCFFAGIPVSTRIERALGHDPALVVIDEVVGMWLALLFIPKSIITAALAFLLFRAFDILKPQPAKYFDGIGGGFGIMMDDVIAGIYANLVLQVVLVLSHSFHFSF